MSARDILPKYDLKSIMHYDGTLFGLFSKPVMKDKLTGKVIRPNKKMSRLDIKKLNEMYPCRSIPTTCGKL